MKRWLLLENEPALRSADFFPPEDAWPELAHLGAEHVRLLAVVRTEQRAYAALRERYESEDAARGTELKAAFLAGDNPGEDGRDLEEARHTDLADARLRAEAATDALVVFLREALAEIEGRCPEWYATLESRREEAEAKVEEARRLVAEAERVVGEADRMWNWLDRFSGVSALGYVPFGVLGVPNRRLTLPQCRRSAAYLSPKGGAMRTLDDKTILLDPDELEAMQTDPTVARETILERAVASGKIPAASRDRYREMYQHDQPGTVALLASLAPGVTPAQGKTLHEFERGQDDELLAAARAAFPELRRRQAGGAQPPPVRSVSPAHVAGEEEQSAATSLSPAASLSSETIANLFPEIRKRGQRSGRVTWADGKPRR